MSNALKDLISCYDSSSSSDSEGEKPLKKKPRLPLPPELANVTTSQNIFERVDEPSKHDGRKRGFAHGPGSWASYFFIQCSSFDFMSLFEAIVVHAPSLKVIEN